VPQSSTRNQCISDVVYGLFSFDERLEAIMKTECIACGAERVDFEDLPSMREYVITGLCQECQDPIYEK